MKNIFLSICLLLSFSFVYADEVRPDFSLVGFATQNGGTTGGAGAIGIIDVSTGEELIAAIGAEKTTTPRIIRVNGTIEYAGDIAIKNCANITLFGADENAFISKASIIITNSSNIIIRNIKFTMTGRGGENDILEITTTSGVSENIWIDHCEFYNETPTAEGATKESVKNKYDELIAIKKSSAYITISWCYFHDHYKGLLIGWSTDKDPEDRKITMHHNRFVRLNSRVPSYRAGTAHVYNNYIEGWIENGVRYGTAVHARDAANLLVENNYFKDLNKAIYWDVKDSPTEGYAWGIGNVFDNVTSELTTRPHLTPFAVPYQVNQDNPADLPALLQQYAGVGVITSYDDYGTPAATNSAPSLSITSPQAETSVDAPADVKFTGQASDTDGSISKIEIYKGNDLLETLSAASFDYDFEGLMSGRYLLAARAYDDKGKFTTQAVTLTVKAPDLVADQSIFGSTVSTSDYFWFGEHADAINSLLSDNTISGSATFNAALDPQIDGKSITEHTGGLVIPKEGGDVIFTLPNCALFKLYLTRTGSFSGNVYASTNGVDWGEPVASISGSKGALEVDFTSEVSSAQAIYVKIVNTSTGGLNIHGANICTAKTSSSSVNNVDNTNKTVVSTRYYTISGLIISKPEKGIIYIQENVYDDGAIERTKYLQR